MQAHENIYAKTSRNTSVELSENEMFDINFEEKVKKQEKLLKIQPLVTDPALEKHNLIYGIVPNERQLDQILYRKLKFKPNLNNLEKDTFLKLETFLLSDKMTHRELAYMQDLKRKRENCELDNN